jgi:hypothetical protein
MAAMINSGLSEAIVLALMVLTLVVNELFSGVDAHPLGKIRRFAQWMIVPLVMLFAVLVAVRLAHVV